MSDQKPLHVEKKPAKILTDEEISDIRERGVVAANSKLDDISPHFSDNVKLGWLSEEDEDEIRFYVTIKVDF